MYSVVLMAAMAANTTEAPGFHRYKAWGCHGGMYLHSGGYGSWAACWGAAGGCMGGGWGSGASGGCYGCMGCYGSWFGYGDYTTAPMAYYPGMNPMTTVPGTTPPTTGTTPPAGATPPVGTTPPGGTLPPPAGATPPPGTSARLIIEKPADAKLYVDDRPIPVEGTRNSFATPSLNPYQAYYYMVRVEIVQDGRPVSETRRVILRSGETVRETFTEPSIVTASLQTPAGR